MFNFFKKQPQTIKVKIDYDKLAKAIADNQKQQEIDYEKISVSIVDAINRVESEKENKESNSKPSAFYSLMQIAAATLLLILSMIMYLLCTSIGYTIGLQTNELISVVSLIIFALGVGSIAAMSLIASVEIYRSKDKELINNSFIAIMAFSSLITAIVSTVIAYRTLKG